MDDTPAAVPQDAQIVADAAAVALYYTTLIRASVGAAAAGALTREWQTHALNGQLMRDITLSEVTIQRLAQALRPGLN